MEDIMQKGAKTAKESGTRDGELIKPLWNRAF